MKKFFILLALLLPFLGKAQIQNAATAPISKETEAQWKAWLDNLYEMGVVVKGDSVIISDEARRIAADANLRKGIYPDTYTWPDAQYLMKQMQVKVGLWYLINLYNQNEQSKQAVLQYVMALDKVADMQKALLSAFYTFIFFDPQAGEMKNGRPDIHHPEILEGKLAVVKEISGYIEASRDSVGVGR